MSADCSERYWDTVFNWLVLGKLHYSTTVSSKCELSSKTWEWHYQYLYWGPYFKYFCFFVYPKSCSWTFENQHTISFLIEVRYFPYCFQHIFLEEMIFCTDNHLILESSNKVFPDWISFTKSLIHPTITNKSIVTRHYQIYFPPYQ